MVLKTLIADDEHIARKVIREELEQLPEIIVVGEAETGAETLWQIRELEPDVVFLDLQMPIMNGFEVVRHLSGSHLPAIVIVTAYNQHAIQAFEAGAIDYLLKPVSAERLQKSVQRAIRLLNRPLENAENLIKIAAAPSSGAPATVRKLVGRNGRDYFLLNVDEILAIQVEKELVWLVTPQGRLLSNQPLRVLAESLKNSSFERVHRNALVNVNHVRKLTPLGGRRWIVTLSNNTELVVSKRQAHHIRYLLECELRSRS